MSPPPAGSGGGRKPLGRLVDALRRRPAPDRTAPPATVPGLGSGEETAVAAAATDDGPSPSAELAADAERAVAADEPPPAADPEPAPPANADARFDEARERLRARIEPPAPDDDPD